MTTELQPMHWLECDPAPDDYIEAVCAQHDLHPVVARILWGRGYHDNEAVKGFLALYEGDDNPFRMKGMAEAVYRIRMAIRHKEKIAVYGDFDADGVTSTTLLTGVLKHLGAKVQAYIPDRVDEGYGLNSPALEGLAAQGVKLVITVDCGIRAVQEVADGVRAGLDIIVTDHHSVGPDLPPAYAVINPQQVDCPYPEKRLAGVGVAYKLVQALFMEAQRRGFRHQDWRPEDWLEFVAIGTVADIMPLTGENRGLVIAGLERLNQTQRPGLLALYKVAKAKPGEITASTIGFVLGPRINAAGRLASAMLAYQLLSARTRDHAISLAEQINQINRERQQKTRDMQEIAEADMGGFDGERALLFAADARFEQGVVGLVASRLTDTHYRPSVVVQMGVEESHGSCRSIPEFHITRALEHCDDLLSRYGGHAMAAGFTVPNENIPALRDRLTDYAQDQLAGRNLTPQLTIDAELTLDEITPALMEGLEVLQPTGEGNPSPMFVSRGIMVSNPFAVGDDGRHLRLKLVSGPTTLDAIAFRMGHLLDDLPERVDVAYQLQTSEWRGSRRIEIHIRDIRPAETAT